MKIYVLCMKIGAIVMYENPPFRGVFIHTSQTFHPLNGWRRAC